MNALKENKGIITLALVVIAGLFIYNSFFSSTEMIDTSVPSAASIGADLIKVSDNLSQAMLSRELFSAAGYRFLADFSKALELGPLGRVNPFAPLGQ